MLCKCLFVLGIENVVLVVLCLRLITQLCYTSAMWLLLSQD